MYAPKFRSWMTDWERFDEALSHRLDEMADDALAEIHDMVEKAMPPKRVELGPLLYYVGGGGGCGGTGGGAGGGGFGPVRTIRPLIVTRNSNSGTVDIEYC